MEKNKETFPALAEKQCVPCEGGTPPMGQAEVESMLEGLEGWEHEKGTIAKTFEFKNHFRTMAFVNAIAWISHRQNHHPDLEVGYNRCRVSYTTHAIGGLSENDFVCAAKVEALFRL